MPDPLTTPETHNTLDQAKILIVEDNGEALTETGTIGDGAEGAAEVTYYHFQLARPAVVDLNLAAQTDPAQSAYVLSLYNVDPYEPLGNRLLAQQDGAANGGFANVVTTLAAGDYFVAVSGSGNRYFNPYLAGSGYDGATGDYQLTLTATAAAPADGDGPTLLRTDPADGAVIATSPLLLRATLSGPVDPNSLFPDATVQLYFNPTGPFGPGEGELFPISYVGYDDATFELLIYPAAPLPKGYYQLVLVGDQSLNALVIQTMDDLPLPLGKVGPDGTGRDFTVAFEVNGIEGNTSGDHPNDTALTAHTLGDITTRGLVQTSGVIGDDATDLNMPFNPADVDLYHFQIVGAGNYAFGAEVFAGRLGSMLDASLQLYRLSSEDQSLQLVASNNDSANDVVASNGTVPLFSDPILFASLTAGDYYLAVTSQFNTYDPSLSHSGEGGFTYGPYLLNLRLDAASTPPRVVSTDAAEGAVLQEPPQTLSVQFDKSVNLPVLAYQSYQETFLGELAAVYLESEDGALYFPRLQSYDAATNRATFLLIHALPNGNYTWHLSGPNGLTDFAGNALVGNDEASGDYLIPFTVAGPERGSPDNPYLWAAQEPNDDLNHPQVIGALFPGELQNTVTIRRESKDAPLPEDVADYYQITLLQSQVYSFSLTNFVGLPKDAVLTVWLDGVQQVMESLGDHGVGALLGPGTYVLGIDWSDEAGSDPSYDLNIALLGSSEPAPALTTGPAPALRFRLATDPPPPTVTNPTPPPSSESPPSEEEPPALVTNPTPPPSKSVEVPVHNPPPSAITPEPPPPVVVLPVVTPPANSSTPGSAPVNILPQPELPSVPEQTGSVIIVSPTAPVPVGPSTQGSGPLNVLPTPESGAVVVGPSTVASPSAPAPITVITNTATPSLIVTSAVQSPAAPPAANASVVQNVVLPGNVVLALSDRALGAGNSQNTDARAFFRETTTTSQPRTGPGVALLALLASSQAYLSGSGQAVGEEEGLILPDISSSALAGRTDLTASVAILQAEVLRRTFEAAQSIPPYADALADLIDSWDFSYSAPKPFPVPSGDAPRIASSLPEPVDFVEQSTNALDILQASAQDVRWYHPSRLAQFGVVVLALTLVSLRIQSWRASRSAVRGQREANRFSQPSEEV